MRLWRNACRTSAPLLRLLVLSVSEMRLLWEPFKTGAWWCGLLISWAHRDDTRLQNKSRKTSTDTFEMCRQPNISVGYIQDWDIQQISQKTTLIKDPDLATWLWPRCSSRESPGDKVWLFISPLTPLMMSVPCCQYMSVGTCQYQCACLVWIDGQYQTSMITPHRVHWESACRGPQFSSHVWPTLRVRSVLTGRLWKRSDVYTSHSVVGSGFSVWRLIQESLCGGSSRAQNDAWTKAGPGPGSDPGLGPGPRLLQPCVWRLPLLNTSLSPKHGTSFSSQSVWWQPDNRR